MKKQMFQRKKLICKEIFVCGSYNSISEAVAETCSVKKVFLGISQNSQVFSCEFCEISKNIFYYRIPPVAASGIYENQRKLEKK